MARARTGEVPNDEVGWAAKITISSPRRAARYHPCRSRDEVCGCRLRIGVGSLPAQLNGEESRRYRIASLTLSVVDVQFAATFRARNVETFRRDAHCSEMRLSLLVFRQKRHWRISLCGARVWMSKSRKDNSTPHTSIRNILHIRPNMRRGRCMSLLAACIHSDTGMATLMRRRLHICA